MIMQEYNINEPNFYQCACVLDENSWAASMCLLSFSGDKNAVISIDLYVDIFLADSRNRRRHLFNANFALTFNTFNVTQMRVADLTAKCGNKNCTIIIDPKCAQTRYYMSMMGLLHFKFL